LSTSFVTTVFFGFIYMFYKLPCSSTAHTWILSEWRVNTFGCADVYFGFSNFHQFARGYGVVIVPREGEQANSEEREKHPSSNYKIPARGWAS
jgi:hypothetical protein